MATDVTAGMLAHNLAMMVEDYADEHLPLISDEDGTETDAQFTDTSQVVAGGNSARFRVQLAGGRWFTVRVEEEMPW